MSKVIPVLPAKSMNEQCAFYESIGFAVAKKYTAPPYAVAEYNDIAIRFWVNRRRFILDVTDINIPAQKC